MSTAMNFGSKSFQPRPPDKGSFPLDHFGERREAGGRSEARIPARGSRATQWATGVRARENDVLFFVLGECKSFKEKFMKCLRDNNFENALCRNESKEYLECRMERQVHANGCHFSHFPPLPPKHFPQE
ncbi:hypothetical protein HPG69_009316, partial [Diceros bicornis minor]